MNNESIGNTTQVNLTDWKKLKTMDDAEIIHDAESPITVESDWSQTFVSHSMTELHTETVRRSNEPHNLPTKEQVAIRFDAEVLNYFRATGQGWQTRMNDVLKAWLREHA